MQSANEVPVIQTVAGADDWFYEKKQPLKRRILCGVAALVGMVVGLIPSLLYGLCMHTSYPLLFMCIPLSCLLFEQIFGCRSMNSSVFWVLGFTVLGWYLAEVLATAADFANVYKIPAYELGRIMYYMLLNGQLWQTITSEPVYSYLFLILGFWIAFEYLRGGHKPEEEAVALPVSEAAEDVSEEAADSEEKTEPNDEKSMEPESDEGEEDDEDGFEFETREQFMQNKEH